MRRGLIFDIKEFAIHDGPGIRTTVFLKGCPLACVWCHNPEGQSATPQILRNPGGERLVGESITSDDLAGRLNRQAKIFKQNGGGVTFSGGEPLTQSAFIAEVITLLDDIHVLLDTCGYGSSDDFRHLLKKVDLVYYDLKLMDPELHQKFTGRDNSLILDNLSVLSQSGVPFVIRVPLIPTITDTTENLSRIANRIQNLPGLVKVDLLPYNQSAGAKYEAAGMRWQPDYDEKKPVNANLKIFEDLEINVEEK